MIYYFEKEYLDGIFINCEVCGRLVKKTNNRVKYCKECAKKINKTNALSATNIKIWFRNLLHLLGEKGFQPLAHYHIMDRDIAE